jgi:hypothetical protein
VIYARGRLAAHKLSPKILHDFKFENKIEDKEGSRKYEKITYFPSLNIQP